MASRKKGGEGHLWRSIVIKVVARQHVALNSEFLGTLSFGVPREFASINRKLIPMRHTSLLFLHRICFSSSICFAFPTFRQRLLPSCCNTFSSTVFRLVYLDTCGSSSSFAKSTLSGTFFILL